MSDKAERLHKLILLVRDASVVLGLKGQPLYMSIDVIARHLNYTNYSDFNEQYLDLCSSVRDEITFIPLKKEEVRQNWLNCIARLRGVFNADNFPKATSHVFENHFDANLSTLDIISERFQTNHIYESSSDELKLAFDAISDAIDEIQKSDKIDERIITLLRHYLLQMKILYGQYEIFGDDKFWKIYKETFSTFVQIQPLIMQSKNSVSILEKVTSAAKSLISHSIAGINLAASIATLAPLFIANSAN